MNETREQLERELRQYQEIVAQAQATIDRYEFQIERVEDALRMFDD